LQQKQAGQLQFAKILHKPEHGAQLNRSKPHTQTGAWRTLKPGQAAHFSKSGG
jgi:hypothetical protein